MFKTINKTLAQCANVFVANVKDTTVLLADVILISSFVRF